MQGHVNRDKAVPKAMAKGGEQPKGSRGSASAGRAMSAPSAQAQAALQRPSAHGGGAKGGPSAARHGQGEVQGGVPSRGRPTSAPEEQTKSPGGVPVMQAVMRAPSSDRNRKPLSSLSRFKRERFQDPQRHATAHATAQAAAQGRGASDTRPLKPSPSEAAAPHG